MFLQVETHGYMLIRNKTRDKNHQYSDAKPEVITTAESSLN